MVKTSVMLECLLSEISRFADLRWQCREWVCWINNPYASFQESMCLLFDGGHFEEILDEYRDQFNFTEKQYQILDEFRKAVNDYADEHGTFRDDIELIKDPEWHLVVKKAQVVLEVFKDYDFNDDKEFIFKKSEKRKTSDLIKFLLFVSADFTNLNWQYREWVCHENYQASSFKRSMFLLYDIAHLENILGKYKDQFDFTEQQYKVLDEFRKALDHYVDEHLPYKDDEEIIKDPFWHEVVKKAQVFVEVFKDYDLKNGKEFIE